MSLSKALILLTLTLTLTPSVFAQTATDGASQLRDSVKQKVDEELAQIKQVVTKKAFLGTITAKNEASLTLTTWLNEARTTLVTTDSTIKLASGKDGTPTDLKVGNFILVMGDADSQNTLTAKRLIVTTAPADDRRLTYFGTVAKKTSSALSITTSKNDTIDLKLTSATTYTGKTKATDVAVGAKVLVLSKSGSALIIHLFPTP